MGTSFDFSKSTIGVDWQQFRAQTLLTTFNSVDVKEGEQHGYPAEDEDNTYTRTDTHEQNTYNEIDPFDPNSDFSLAGSFTYKYDISNLHPTRFFNDDPEQPVWWYWTETRTWLHNGSDTITSFNNFLIDGVQVNVILNGYYQYGAPYQVTYSDALGKSVAYFETELQGFWGSDFADTFILGSQNDVLYAGDGADTINGNGGVDILNLGYEDGAVDTVIYDSLADVSTDAIYYNADTIQAAGMGDRIDFSAIGGLHYIEKIEFSGRAGEYRFTGNNSGTGTVQFDADGDGQADHTLAITFDTDAQTASLNQSSLGSNILVVGAPSTDIVAPAIQSVSIPNAPLNIGDTATATLTVASDIDAYTLSSGSIAGYALSNFVKVNGTTYTAQFTVTEGGAEVAASASVPVNIVLRDTAGNLSTAYTAPITQTLDLIDGRRPELVSGTVRGDKVVLTFNEALGSPGPTTSDITIMVGGVQREAGSFTVSGATITMTLSQAVTPGQTVTLTFSELFDANNNYDNYAAPQDLAGNDADAFSLTLTNLTPGTPTAGNDVLAGTEGIDTIDGLAGNDNISGLGGNDTLIGGIGNDTLDGGLGNDTMIGGIGDDTYYVDSSFDTTTEAIGAGTDIVYASTSFALQANVENLTLTGTGNFQAIGNDLANIITGNSGNNQMTGGLGADFMYGGAGDDSYTIDNSFDQIFENSGEGTADVVYASVSYALGANVENLNLTGTGNFQAIGNNINNVIIGNDGDNLMDGGIGIDGLLGGKGNDSYMIDNSFDQIVENANEGADIVYTSVDYQLGANLENVYMQGTAGLAVYGNETANLIIGNDGNNLLNGGAGIDGLIGGKGDDTYVIDNSFDQIVENASEGTDTVYAAVSYQLGDNLESLFMSGPAVQGFGNGVVNSIVGTTGNNAIDGKGGADVLTGNGGSDTFIFRAGETNGDTIMDFDGAGAAGGDQLLLAGYGAGASLQQISAIVWQIDYNGNTSHEQFTLANSASLHASDWAFT